MYEFGKYGIRISIGPKVRVSTARWAENNQMRQSCTCTYDDMTKYTALWKNYKNFRHNCQDFAEA